MVPKLKSLENDDKQKELNKIRKQQPKKKAKKLTTTQALADKLKKKTQQLADKRKRN